MQARQPAIGAIGARGAVARHIAAFPQAGTNAFRTFSAIPDLVNGRVDTFSFIYVSAGLAEPWRWIPDAWLAAMRAPNNEANLRLRVVAEATYHARKLVASGMVVARAHVLAVLLAAARVSIRRAWGIAQADIVAAQLMPEGGATAAQLTVDVDGNITADATDWFTVAEQLALKNALAAVYDAHSNGMLANAVRAAIGMPVVNGVTLVMTLTHHYQDPNKRVCDVVIDQTFGIAPAIPAEMSVDDLKDVLCHKSAHPIDSPVLIYFARNESVKIRLQQINLGSAAVRVPAAFSPERAASAYHALLTRVLSVGRTNNVAVDLSAVNALVVDTSTAIRNSPDATGIQEAERAVSVFKGAHGYDIAWGAGFLTALYDETNAPARARTAVEAWSVKALVEEHTPGYAEGYEHYGIGRKYRRTMAREGFLPGHALCGAAVPDALTSPEALARAAERAAAAAAARPGN